MAKNCPTPQVIIQGREKIAETGKPSNASIADRAASNREKGLTFLEDLSITEVKLSKPCGLA